MPWLAFVHSPLASSKHYLFAFFRSVFMLAFRIISLVVPMFAKWRLIWKTKICWIEKYEWQTKPRLSPKWQAIHFYRVARFASNKLRLFGLPLLKTSFTFDWQIFIRFPITPALVSLLCRRALKLYKTSFLKRFLTLGRVRRSRDALVSHEVSHLATS